MKILHDTNILSGLFESGDSYDELEHCLSIYWELYPNFYQTLRIFWWFNILGCDF